MQTVVDRDFPIALDRHVSRCTAAKAGLVRLISSRNYRTQQKQERKDLSECPSNRQWL